MRPWCSASLLDAARTLLLAAAVLGAVSSHSLVARAEATTEERAAAAALFDEGRRLMKEGSYEQACSKLEDSFRLVPGVGTRFHLAECYAHSGKLASAWLFYREVAAEMARTGDTARENATRELIKALEPRMCRLQIDVPPHVEGLTITRNGRVVNQPLWNIAFPIDAGTHTIEATAPGRQGRKVVARVQGEGQTVQVRIPRLEPTPVASTDAPGGTGQDEDTGDALSTAGWVAFGSGLAVGVLGGVLLGVGYSKTSEADDMCGGRQGCTPDAAELGNDGRRIGGGGYLVTAIGGTAVLAGVVMLVVSAAQGDAPPAEASGNERRRASGRLARPRLDVGLAPAAARIRLSW